MADTDAMGPLQNFLIYFYRTSNLAVSVLCFDREIEWLFASLYSSELRIGNFPFAYHSGLFVCLKIFFNFFKLFFFNFY